MVETFPFRSHRTQAEILEEETLDTRLIVAITGVLHDHFPDVVIRKQESLGSDLGDNFESLLVDCNVSSRTVGGRTNQRSYVVYKRTQSPEVEG